MGYLLDQIRLNGEEKELKDEVLQLSREYGIMTPYTSYLVLESEDEYQKHGLRPQGVAPAVKSEPVPARRWNATADTGAAAYWRAGERDRVLALRGSSTAIPVFDAESPVPGESIMNRKKARSADATGFAPEAYGREAVDESKTIRDYKLVERFESEGRTLLRHVGKRIFYLIEGVWTDRGYKKGMTEQKVVYASDAYFELLEKHPELKQFFALGMRVIVCLEEGTAIIVEAEDAGPAVAE